jgi:hypothetical protein
MGNTRDILVCKIIQDDKGNPYAKDSNNGDDCYIT